LIQTKDKKFVAAGFAESTQTIGGYNLQQSYIIKFDLNNPITPIWKLKNYGKLTFNNLFFCLKELKDSTILAGSMIDTLEMAGGQINCLTRINKIRPNGTVVWNRFFNYRAIGSTSLNYQKIKSLNLCSDGSWISAIECFNPGVKNPLFFIKYDSTGCDSTLAYCARFMNTVGIAESNTNARSVDVFPNPVNNILNITISDFNSTEHAKLIMTDLSGRLIKEQEIIMRQQALDLKELELGVYIITVTRDKELLYKGKIVKE
jgi:hypothetical protein